MDFVASNVVCVFIAIDFFYSLQSVRVLKSRACACSFDFPALHLTNATRRPGRVDDCGDEDDEDGNMARVVTIALLLRSASFAVWNASAGRPERL